MTNRNRKSRANTSSRQHNMDWWRITAVKLPWSNEETQFEKKVWSNTDR